MTVAAPTFEFPKVLPKLRDRVEIEGPQLVKRAIDPSVEGGPEEELIHVVLSTERPIAGSGSKSSATRRARST